MPINYQNGKIYSIRSHQTNMIYIGSTTQTLAQRLTKHMSGYKAYLVNGKRYTSSYEIIKYGDSYIELVEVFPCSNKMELCKREGQFIRTTENTTNRRIEGRTKQEYRTDNADTIKERDTQYQQNNKETIKDKKKQYQQNNVVKIREYLKQYRQGSKRKIILEQQKQWDYDNKEKRETRKEKHSCYCGGKYTAQHRTYHFKTLKHTQYQTLFTFILS